VRGGKGVVESEDASENSSFAGGYLLETGRV
jgi:hypothetical protein